MPQLRADQWEQIRTRRLKGESGRALAREFGVTEGAIRKRLEPEIKHVKQVATRVVEADRALRSLPPRTQKYAEALIEQMQAVSVELAATATHAAMTARRLAEHAGAQVHKINADDPMETQEVLQGISALTKMSNEASVIPLALLNANRAKMDATVADDAKTAPPTEIASASVRIRERLERLAAE